MKLITKISDIINTAMQRLRQHKVLSGIGVIASWCIRRGAERTSVFFFFLLLLSVPVAKPTGSQGRKRRRRLDDALQNPQLDLAPPSRRERLRVAWSECCCGVVFHCGHLVLGTRNRRGRLCHPRNRTRREGGSSKLRERAAG